MVAPTQRDGPARDYKTICGEVPGTEEKYPYAIDPLTGAMPTTPSGGGSPPAIPSALVSGTKTLGGTAERVIVASTPLKDGITLVNKDPVEDVWVGHDGTVAIDNGVQVSSGESLPVVIDDLNKVWVFGIATKKLQFIGG